MSYWGDLFSDNPVGLGGTLPKSTECDCQEENNHRGRDYKESLCLSKLPIHFQSSVSLTFVVYMLTAGFLHCELLIKQALLWWRMWWDFEELPICAPAGMGKADALTYIVALV